MKHRARYRFCYTIDGWHTESPLYLSVLAHTLTEAIPLARAKLDRILKHQSRPYWEGTSSDGKTIEWVRVVPPLLTGKLYKGSRVKPWRRPTKEQLERSRQVFDEFVRKVGYKDAEAMASALSAPILQVIETAPTLEAYFRKDLDQGNPVVPFRYLVYSRRKPPPTL